MSACLTQLRTAVSVRSSSRATLPTVLPGWRTSSTTSALNSRLHDRRGRGLFDAIVPILDILSGASPHLADVRQEEWRRLAVVWPSYLATHSTAQTLYFGSDGLSGHTTTTSRSKAEPAALAS